jgi:hypothetical protein
LAFSLGEILSEGFPMKTRTRRAGLATASAKRVVAGSGKMEVARVQITDAGRRALEKARR